MWFLIFYFFLLKCLFIKYLYLYLNHEYVRFTKRRHLVLKNKGKNQSIKQEKHKLQLKSRFKRATFFYTLPMP